MWKQLFESLKQLLLLTEQTQQNRSEIKELRQEIRDLAKAVERLAYELHRSRENEAHERHKMALQLENEMLRFERRLPPSKPDENDDSA